MNVQAIQYVTIPQDELKTISTGDLAYGELVS